MRKFFKYFFSSTVLIFIGLIAHADKPVKRQYKCWGIESVSEIIINNQFGNIDFVVPRTDSVTVEATFDIQNLSKNNAKYLAEQVYFNVFLSGKTLKIETTYTKNFKTNQDFKIRIRIQAPENCNVNITNRFGDVNLNNLQARGSFNIEYGNLTANQLRTTNSTPINLDLKYGRAEIKFLENLNAKLNYGELFCNNIEKMDLDVQYSIVDIDNIADAQINSHLDNITIDTIKTLNIESNYSTITIKSLSKFLDINMKHGEINVDKLIPDFDTITINNIYGKVFINTGNISYSMNSETFFTEIDYTNGTILDQKTLKDQIFLKSKTGTEENNSLINVKSRYGTVHITQ